MKKTTELLNHKESYNEWGSVDETANWLHIRVTLIIIFILLVWISFEDGMV